MTLFRVYNPVIGLDRLVLLVAIACILNPTIIKSICALMQYYNIRARRDGADRPEHSIA